VTEADAAGPVPPSEEFTVEVVLFCAPSAMPVTFAEKLQEALAASVAPERATLVEPATAEMVPPPHVPFRPLGVLMTRPAGKLSVKVTEVRGPVVLGFDTVKVSEVEALKFILAAPKDFCSVGGATTVMLALAVLPVPALADVTVTLLLLAPAAAPVTFTTMVQEPETGSVAPDREMEELPADAVIVPPPQLPVSPLGDAICNPVGKLSVNATPASAIAFGAGFVSVNVSEVVPFRGTLSAPKALLIVGGLATVSAAEAALPVPPLVELTGPELFV
jgi:hypothetical protein